MAKRCMPVVLVMAAAASVPLFGSVFGVGGAPGGAALSVTAETTARFEWRVPDRTGLDRDGDGIVDAARTPDDVVPLDGWPVHFDACGSTPADGAAIVSYTWYVDQQFIGEGRPCGGFTHWFPREGSYEIALTVRDSRGVEAHVIETIVVQDFLVVALGDSFGSGQGNPDIPIPGPDFEQARQAYGVYTARLRDLLRTQGAFDEVERKTRAASQRYQDYTRALLHEADVCLPLSPNFNLEACGTATEALAAAHGALAGALADLGLSALLDTLTLIDASLREALEAAQAAVDLAEAAVADALDALEAAQAALSPVWQDRRCNRSALAGQAQAALALERADSHTSVTLVHLACSGAEISSGVVGPYAGVEPPVGAPALPSQIDQALALVRDREVDAVLLSIGGNDAGFGPIVEACVKQEPCDQSPSAVDAAVEPQIALLCEALGPASADCRRWWEGIARDRSAAEIFDAGVAALPGRYRRLAASLAEAFPAVAAEPNRVYITEYPNAVQDFDGSLCDSAAYPDPFVMLPGISGGEALWLRDTVTVGLNAKVAEAAAEHAWTFVSGIFSRFTPRGYCSSVGWFRRMQDSFTMQGTKEGAVHPTAAGHAASGAAIADAMQADLFPATGGGPGTAPRPPNPNLATVHDTTPPEVTGLPSRQPDANGWYSADVVIDWQAADPAPSAGGASDPPDTVAATEGSGVVFTSSPSCDPRANCGTGSLALSIDKTPPSVACAIPTATFTLGTTGAVVSATVSDALSGPAATTVSAAADTSTAGAKTVVLTGTDLAGHTRSERCAYGVTYNFSGFQAPVDGGGVMNVVNAGRAVPLRWRLTDGAGVPFESLSTASFTVQGLDCASGTTADLIEETAAGGSGLQNLGNGYYQLNWKTPTSYANSCKTLRLNLGEGIARTALFKFR